MRFVTGFFPYNGAMPNEVERLVETGNGALKAGNWRAARDSFQDALAREEIPEALFGLGTALWWLGDMHGAIEHLEQAYPMFRRRPDPVLSAACALRLGFHYKEHLANSAAATGWLARAARLIEQHGLDALRGELLLMKACLTEDPAAGTAWAHEALELGRKSNDLDLELCSMSQLGALLVEQGRVAEGMAMLDEAMAGCVGGEPGNLDTVAFTGCTTMVSCARGADFERAAQWVRATERFVERYGSPFILAECRTVHARVLLATGDWRRAEATAKDAIDMCRTGAPAYHAESLAVLAELRVAQGRDEEAERLLAGLEDQVPAVAVLASIHLRRGKAGAAAAVLRRALDAMGSVSLEGAVLHELLGEAEISLGQEHGAAERGRALAELGRARGCPLFLARGCRLHGRALAGNDAAAACDQLGEALGVFVRLRMPFEAARTRCSLAEVFRALDPEGAKTEARTALSAFEALGANAHADAAAALLRALGVKAARTGASAIDALTKRERQVLALIGEGLSNPDIASRLFLSRKTVEHHVAHILAKLGLRNRAEAAAEAVRRLGAKSAAK